MLELLIISRPHTIVCVSCQLVGIFIVEVISCKGESGYIVFVRNRTRCMGRIARVSLLLRLLVLQIALDEGADASACVHTLHVLIVDARWGDAELRRRLRLRLTVLPPLTVLIACSLAAADLIKVEVVTALAGITL